MMDACPSLLAHYQHIIALSENMLLMARQSEWDALVYIEEKYVQAVAKIAELNATVEQPLSVQVEEKITLLLRRLLDNESEVNQLLQARMTELQTLIGQSTRQQSLNSAYQKFADRSSVLAGEVKTTN